MASFVHLHVHSQFSLLESSCDLKKLCKKAASYEMPALAVTDNGNMFGAIEFYFAAKDAGIKPIIGLDAYIAPKGRKIKGENKEVATTPNRRIVLLAQNHGGYQNLCKISSIGYQEGFYYKPRIDYEVLAELNSDLLALSGGIRGDVAFTFLEHGPDKALEKVRELQLLFPERFYLELIRTNLSEQKALNDFLIEASRITGVPCVAANDVHYLERDDALAQQVMMCIGTNRTLQDESKIKLGSDEFYFKSPDQMRRLFEDVPGVCDRTLEVAERCDIKFKFKDETGKPIYHLPTYPTPDGVTLTDEIKRLSFEGLELRFKEAEARGEPVSENEKPRYYDRLNFELSVIDRMGFNGYFLIVQDFIGWAKNHDIPVGPGRGSGAGSLVAYSLRITDLDPMIYNLIFERFLNPERISMPDFDVDFCQDRRMEVINYVTSKYTQQCVSQIITFGKLQTKAAIRDVGRVLGMTFGEVDVIAKLIPDKLGITLKESLEKEPRLTEMMEENPKISNLMELAQKIEGLNRHASVHAAGVIISNRPLVEYAPLYRGEDDQNVIQFDMKHAEKIGLIKFDFLGLKTLTLISDALKLVEKNRGKKFSTSDISLKDAGIYALMSKGDTAGIFQFEGDGISDLIKKVRPSCFEDITAINALYRPGPMQMLDEYIGRKHGKIRVSYLFPQLEEVLKETYGIIVYQEQVQLIAARIASYSLGEADMLRRAMGKKIPAEMAQQKTRFMDGALKNGFDEEKSEELFNLMAKFAEYGFNKSHAAAYCVVAAQTAWLKAYYPVEFYAALLSTEMSDTDKIVKYVKDARSHGIEVRAPHVSFSDYKFSVHGDSIFFGIGAIKGVGEAAVEAILEARSQKANQKFESLQDFFTSVDLRRVNKKVIECLIKAGALDGFGGNRAQLMACYTQFMERAESHRKDRELGQINLFGGGETEETEKIELPQVVPWKKSVQLESEKEVLGFYLSDHPLSGFAGIFKPFITANLAEIPKLDHKREIWIGGMVSTFRELITKKGTRMAFASIEDLSGSIDLVIFPDTYAKTEILLKGSEPLLIKGTLEKDDGRIQVIVEQIQTLEERVRNSSGVLIKLDDSQIEKLEALKTVLDKFPGKAPVSFRIAVADLHKQVTLQVLNPEGVTPNREFFEDLQIKMGSTDFVEIRG